MSLVTDPNFGFGISPLGPKTLPNFESLIIIPGVQINFSKFIFPDFISSMSSSLPTISAPASFASVAGAEERNIMAMTGHKTTQMVRRYIKEANLFKNNALNKIKI